MEYCHCGSVGAYLKRGNRLNEEELLFAGIELSACEEHHSQSEYVR